MSKNIFNIIILSSLFFSYNLKAQVGFGTNEPKTSLEVKEYRVNNLNLPISKDAILIPTLSKLELASKDITTYNSLQYGTLVYVNNILGDFNSLPSVDQVINITKNGFYYFGNENKWFSTEGDTTEDIWSNNTIKKYVELKNTSQGSNRPSNSNVVITDDGFIGINNETPIKKLDINASIDGVNPDYIKINSLKEIDATTRSNTLVIDNNGNIYKNDVENLSAQIMRIPIAGFTLGTTHPTQGSIRLDFESENESPACFVNSVRICNKNFINTIKGMVASDLVRNVTLRSSVGTVARVTDRVKLPMGIYKIQIRLVGYYTTPFDIKENVNNNLLTQGTTILKLAVGNSEFSVSNFQVSTYGPNSLTSTIFTDYINLNKDDYVDFLLDPVSRPFTIVPYVEENGKRIIKSMVLIERMR